MSSQFDYLLKFILIGDSSVGKSNIFSVYRDGTFSEKLQPSIGVEFIAKNITINDTIFRIQVWDTAGQENFVSMTKVYYRNSSVAFIIYDITEKESFHHIEFWLNLLKKEAPESILLVLIGNKNDMNNKRQINYEQGKDFAEKHKMLFFEVSAKNKINIDKIFQESTQYIYNNIEKGIYNLNDDSCGVKLCNTQKNINIEELDIEFSSMKGNSVKNKRKKCC